MIKYSIIIPHKNTPGLLQQLLNSIPIRDDTQVIVVDDNSDPNIVDFNKFPKWNGVNYEFYLTKKGKGAGFARNFGIKHAIGEWLLFADADDIYFSDSLSTLLDIPNEKYDIICFPLQIIQYDGKTEMLHLPSIGKQTEFDASLSGEHRIVDNYIDDLIYRLFLPTQKMVKRDIVITNAIRFSEVPSCNDILFSLKVQSKCQRIGVFTDIVYHYIKYKGSTSDVINTKRLKQRIRELLRVQKFLLSHNKQIYIESTLNWHYNELLKHSFISSVIYSMLQMIIVSPRIGLRTLRNIIRNAKKQTK